MRRIAILTLTFTAAFCTGCGWHSNYDWCRQTGGLNDRRIRTIPGSFPVPVDQLVQTPERPRDF